MRILSLLPAATEIIYLLGLEKYLVGVSHECDFPKQALKLPKITSSPVSNDLSSLEINNEVAKLKHKGSGVFHIDEQKLRHVKPNLILTQELCDVCAISWTQVKKASKILSSVIPENIVSQGSSIDSGSQAIRNDNFSLQIISLEPESIKDILENILLIGEFSRRSQESKKIVASLKKRLKNLDSRLKTVVTYKPKVLIIEWLDPLMVAGHWVPEMVEKAGGINLITTKGQKSYPIIIDQIVKSAPDILIFAPCGFDIKRTLKEKVLIKKITKKLPTTNYQLYLMDGNAYLTRPGPRIIDGMEIFSEIFHPHISPKKHSFNDWIDFLSSIL